MHVHNLLFMLKLYKHAFSSKAMWNIRIYSNKCRSAYLIFRATSAAVIRGRRLFEGGVYLNILPDKFTFAIFLFNGYPFYLFIFLWTDAKLIINLELREKFTR